MTKRLDVGIARGCQGFDPDNVDGYSHKEQVLECNGCPAGAKPIDATFAQQAQLDYNRGSPRPPTARERSLG